MAGPHCLQVIFASVSAKPVQQNRMDAILVLSTTVALAFAFELSPDAHDVGT